VIETWIKNGWQGIGKPVSRRMSFMPIGCWIVILVVAVVGGRMLWGKIKNHQRDEIAIAFGRACLPSGAPQPSHDGKRITLVQVGDKGIGVFLCDLATGRQQLIHQKGAKQNIFLTLGVEPWSPDDRFFVYTGDDLVVCESDTGQELARFSTDGFDHVAGLVWLGAEKFAYVSRRGNLHVIQKQKNQWQEMPIAGGIKISGRCLSALSTNTLAWQKGNRIWTLNLDARLAAIVFELKTGRLNDFNYDREAGLFLLSSTENGSDSLWRMTSSNTLTSNRVKMVSATSVHEVAWIAGSNGACAYLSSNPHRPDQNILMFQSDFGSDPVKLFGQGNVSSFTATPDGRQLLMVGTISNELAAGIWQYDLTAKTLHEVVPCTDQPSPLAQNVEPMHGVLNLAGRRLDYFVYPPTDFNRHAHKKYPVIIGNTLYRTLDPVYQNRVQGPLWAPALARCGAYVVIVERAGGWFNGIDQWGENIMGVYQKLAQDPTIDTHQVFLFATSAETPYLNGFVKKHPDLWVGLMQFNGASPDLSVFPTGKPAPRILLTVGTFEERESALKQYQEYANQQGVAVDTIIHPDSAHVLMGKEPLTQKTRAITRFVFDE